jgi:hypothetical protein
MINQVFIFVCLPPSSMRHCTHDIQQQTENDLFKIDLGLGETTNVGRHVFLLIRVYDIQCRHIIKLIKRSMSIELSIQ